MELDYMTEKEGALAEMDLGAEWSHFSTSYLTSPGRLSAPLEDVHQAGPKGLTSHLSSEAGWASSLILRFPALCNAQILTWIQPCRLGTFATENFSRNGRDLPIVPEAQV